MLNPEIRNQITALVRHWVVPAMGCTEPICVALATAKATEILGTTPVKVEALLSIVIAEGNGPVHTEAFKKLKEKGAKRIFCFDTFGLFTDGCDKFDKAYEAGIIDRVLSTNLVYRRPGLLEKPWHVDVNMCKYVAFLVDTLNHDDTISRLIDPVDRINNVLKQYNKR